MNQRNENKHMVDVLFVIILFCVFAVSALILVMIGANVYKKTVNDMDLNFDSRTSFAYVTEKIRQNDAKDALSIREFGGNDAICITKNYNGTDYYTYLYYYDGYLREMNVRADSIIDPAMGSAILAIDSFTISQSNEHLYSVVIETAGNESTIYISTRSN